jgi:hypothetical protein
MLPAIREHAMFAFRHDRPVAKADAVAEVVANCFCAFARLVAQGKANVAYPSALAGFAIRQYRDGRRTGNRLRIGDVLSEYARQKKQIVVERLDKYDEQDEAWQEAIVEDDRTPVADQAAFRVDFPAWLTRQTKRNRRIAEAMAVGERTSDVARRFRISPGRVSQLRREFHADWLDFHGEKAAT